MSGKSFRILAIGDIVGIAGTRLVQRELWRLRRELEADFVCANGENAAKGNGIDADTASLLFSSGADVITSGNHIFRKHELKHRIDQFPYLLRPANYPAVCPGTGSCVFAAGGVRILVINLLGTIYMESMDSPFEVAERILTREEGRYELAIVDIHAEATSEKAALAKYLDGRVSAVFGTHTHVQTADEKVLPGGTGYLTDLGMTGPYDSILGVKNEIIVEKFLTKMPVRFEEADGAAQCNGALFTIDLDSRKCEKVERVNWREDGLRGH